MTSSATSTYERGTDRATVPINSELPISSSIGAHLPRFKLLKFTGRPRDRPTFWNTVEQTVHLNRKTLSGLKFFYLTELLTDVTKAPILGILSKPQNHPVLVQKLELCCSSATVPLMGEGIGAVLVSQVQFKTECSGCTKLTTPAIWVRCKRSPKDRFGKNRTRPTHFN